MDFESILDLNFSFNNFNKEASEWSNIQIWEEINVIHQKIDRKEGGENY